MKTIIEPFRIKMTESIKITTKAERIVLLEKAHQNVFLIDAEDCIIDLLTDSGTGAMSSDQWSALMQGDESYAGSRSWKKFKTTIKKISGMKHIFPTHQGRAAESLLALTQIKRGDKIPNNSHFDTTRANVEFAGAEAVNLLCEEGLDLSKEAPFKGNIDLEKLKLFLDENDLNKIPFCMITVTNNTGGGQPVSMKNIRELSKLLKSYKLPFVIDACRFAENSYFIQQREDGYNDIPLIEIAQEMFSYADAATMSLKKDGLANIGGFFICNNDEWAEDFRSMLILKEGFPTYGGLAGRDLEVISVGIMEALEKDYQHYRHATVSYVGNALEKRSIPYVKPVGGHAVFIDVKKFLPNIDPLEYPGIALVNALYIEGGIRAVELGTVMFATFDANGNEKPSPLELVRLAFPRRVYTQSHIDYLIDILTVVWENRSELKGYKIVKQVKVLRHFSCHFEKLR